MQKKKDKNLMKTDVKPMKQGLLSRIFHLYYDGFRTMTLGKTLWTIILIKLAIIFLVLKLLSFRIILTVMQRMEIRRASYPRKF